MIDFYMAGTPNVHKVTLMLEELGLPYKAHKVDLKALDQKKPEFLAMNPNGRVPVIVDNEGPGGKKITIFESGAILYYLAEKAGGKFLGHDLAEKTAVLQWVMFQMSAIGPNFGNFYYGHNYMEPKTPAFIERFEKESRRLLSVMEMQLAGHTYLAGESYSIADMVSYPWVANFAKMQGDWFEPLPSVRRWLSLIAERPATKKVFAT